MSLTRLKKSIVKSAIKRTNSSDSKVLCDSICEDLVNRYPDERAFSIATSKMGLYTTKEIKEMIECYFSEENSEYKNKNQLPKRGKTIWS